MVAEVRRRAGGGSTVVTFFLSLGYVEYSNRKSLSSGSCPTLLWILRWEAPILVPYY